MEDIENHPLKFDDNRFLLSSRLNKYATHYYMRNICKKHMCMWPCNKHLKGTMYMLSASILISYEMGPNMRSPWMHSFMILDQWPYIYIYIYICWSSFNYISYVNLYDTLGRNIKRDYIASYHNISLLGNDKYHHCIYNGCWDEGNEDESEDNLPSSMFTLIVWWFYKRFKVKISNIWTVP